MILHSKIKSIPTKYKGIVFRSRLEAKWAVYLDLMGYSWKYEEEGFTDGSVNYLPDFLVEDSFFIEVKPSIDVSNKEIDKIILGSQVRDIVIVCGVPSIKNTFLITQGSKEFIKHDVVLTCGSNRVKYGYFFYTCDKNKDFFSEEYKLSKESNDYDLIYNKNRILD